jgi:hypothetical protein
MSYKKMFFPATVGYRTIGALQIMQSYMDFCDDPICIADGLMNRVRRGPPVIWSIDTYIQLRETCGGQEE